MVGVIKLCPWLLGWCFACGSCSCSAPSEYNIGFELCQINYSATFLARLKKISHCQPNANDRSEKKNRWKKLEKHYRIHYE